MKYIWMMPPVRLTLIFRQQRAYCQHCWRRAEEVEEFLERQKCHPQLRRNKYAVKHSTSVFWFGYFHKWCTPKSIFLTRIVISGMVQGYPPLWIYIHMYIPTHTLGRLPMHVNASRSHSFDSAATLHCSPLKSIRTSTPELTPKNTNWGRILVPSALQSETWEFPTMSVLAQSLQQKSTRPGDFNGLFRFELKFTPWVCHCAFLQPGLIGLFGLFDSAWLAGGTEPQGMPTAAILSKQRHRVCLYAPRRALLKAGTSAMWEASLT